MNTKPDTLAACVQDLRNSARWDQQPEMTSCMEAVATRIEKLAIAQRLAGAYLPHSGGPNPYYKCKACGETVPGLESWLTDHLDGVGGCPCPKAT